MAINHAEQLNQIIDVFNASHPTTNQVEWQSDLSTLKDANVFFTTSVLGMKAISHVIEDQATSLGGSFRFYSAFQKFSRVKAQQNRYEKLLETKNPLYIFGIPDMPLWKDPNLIEVELEQPMIEGRAYLAHNWFVVLHNPQFVSMALVSREVPSPTRPIGAPDKLVYRSFEGFWTYDTNVINHVVEVLDSYIRQKLGAEALRP